MWPYPETKRKIVAETIHGVKITDPYRWLENGDSFDVQHWVVDQNHFTRKILRAHSPPSRFQKELRRYFKTGFVSTPQPVAGQYFWAERKSNQNQFAIYVKRGLNGRPRVLVDPNRLQKDGTVAIDFWKFSPRGTFLSYGLSQGGTEVSTMHILHVPSGRKLKERILNTRFADVAWLPDESGFYYTRHAWPGTVPKKDEHYYQRVYFHKLGTDPKKDPLIFGSRRPKEDMQSITLSTDGRYLAVDAGSDWSKNDTYLYDTIIKRWFTIAEGRPYKFDTTFAGGKIFLHTNYKAERYKVLVANLNKLPAALEKWGVFIPESKNVLLDITFTADKILAEYLVNASSEVQVLNYQGRSLGRLPLPKYCSLEAIGSSRVEKEFLFQKETFTNSNTIYRYDPTKNRYQLYYASKLKLNPASWQVKQEWFKSRDGTPIPMFIIHHREIRRNGNNPAVLYGYGGFAYAITPFFSSAWLPFLKRGGILAVANIRGGSEFGEKWHKDGMLSKKQNCFDDFIAAAEFLIKRKYTNAQKLGILGGSNGGLLVGACMIQRPDLFKAVICEVPLLDMIRFPNFLIAKRWVYEYGNPSLKKDFRWLIRWSPYHNVKSGTEYPAALFTTANKDFRVDPMHARKMAALLQATNRKNIVLLRTEMEAGHGAGKPINKIVKEQADILAFVHWQLWI